VTAQPPATAQANAQSGAEGHAPDGKLSDESAALLKENMAMKKKLKAIETAQADAEQKALADQGKHKELAELATKKANTLAQKLIQAELVAKLPGLIKPDLIKLCDASSLQISDDGSIEGINELAEAFRTANPEYFHADSKPVVPGVPKPGNTAGATGPRTYDDYEKLPRSEQIEWATKNPQAFRALADAAMQRKG
jgi:hypothetical protein